MFVDPFLAPLSEPPSLARVTEFIRGEVGQLSIGEPLGSDVQLARAMFFRGQIWAVMAYLETIDGRSFDTCGAWLALSDECCAAGRVLAVFP